MKRVPFVLLAVMALASSVSAYSAETAGITLEYGKDWRISEKSQQGLVITHIDNPGNVLLAVNWVPAQGTAQEAASIYKEKLEVFGAEIEELEGKAIGELTTVRFASRLPASSIVVLHDFFTSGGRLYHVSFTADEDDFIAYAASADDVIADMELSGASIAEQFSLELENDPTASVNDEEEGWLWWLLGGGAMLLMVTGVFALIFLVVFILLRRRRKKQKQKTASSISQQPPSPPPQHPSALEPETKTHVHEPPAQDPSLQQQGFKYCTSCGAKIAADAQYCTECGAKQ